MQELELRLTLAEVNQVLSARGGQPYKDVFALVTRIQQQSQPPLEAQEEAQQPAAGPIAE